MKIGEQPRNSCTFYRSWLDIIHKIPECDRLVFFEAIVVFALDGNEPKFDGWQDALWTSIRPIIVNQWAKSHTEAGAPKGNKNASKQSKNNQNQSTDNLYKGKGIGEDIEKDRGIGKESNIIPVDEISAYCSERGYTFNIEKFCQWLRRKVEEKPAALKNWKAAADGWQKREPPADVSLGVGEYWDNGRRTYGTGRITIPKDAPPRPGDAYSWNAENNNWIIQ